MSKREEELSKIRQAEAKEQLALSRQLSEQRRLHELNASKQHDYIYEKLHGEERDDGTFESSFVKKENNAIRYEFINKIRSAQSKIDNPKKVQKAITSRAQTTEISNSAALARDRLLNRMPVASK